MTEIFTGTVGGRQETPNQQAIKMSLFFFEIVVLTVPHSIKNILKKKEGGGVKKKRETNGFYINFLITAKIIIEGYKLVLRYFILWVGDWRQENDSWVLVTAHLFLVTVSQESIGIDDSCTLIMRHPRGRLHGRKEPVSNNVLTGTQSPGRSKVL